MNLFRGYIEVKDKKPIDKISNYVSLSEIQSADSYSGVLADDVILIDVDDRKQASILFEIVNDLNINTVVYETRRGKHFYFKNTNVDKNATDTRTAVGINVDIKVGAKKKSLGTLKVDGVLRPQIRTCDVLDPLPKWLTPVASNVDFNTNRNQSFFNYILTLQSAGFEKDEARQTIQLMNKYIIDEPLDNTELSTILRDEAFNKEIFYSGKTFLFQEFAKFIVSEHSVKRLNGILHAYEEGIYRKANIEALMIKHIPDLRKAMRSEVLAYIELLVRNDEELAPTNYIAFKNGIYDIKTDDLQPFTPELVITNKIEHNYDPDAYHSLLDEILDNVSVKDKEVRLLLEEMVGYTFLRRNELRKFFMLVGDGQNGKSTLLNTIKHLLRNNHSDLDIMKLNDRFSTEMLVNKLANIGDDVSSTNIRDTSTIKKIASGDSIDAEEKGKPKFSFTPYCKLIFSSNTIPKIGVGDDIKAVMSRMVIVPLNANFSEKSKDFKPFIIDDITSDEAMSYLINLGIAGLKRILARKKFTDPKVVQASKEEYESSLDETMEYIKALTYQEVIGEYTSTIYKEYQTYCFNQGVEPVTKINFNMKINKHFKIKTKNKRRGSVMDKIFTDPTIK